MYKCKLKPNMKGFEGTDDTGVPTVPLDELSMLIVNEQAASLLCIFLR